MPRSRRKGAGVAERRRALRVLHLVKTTAGADWALRQMRELVSAGCEIHVALPDDKGLSPRYRAAGVTVHVAPCDLAPGSPWRIVSRIRTLRRLVGRLEPDLLHSHFVGTTLTARLALGRRRSPRRVFQVPGPLHLEHRAPRRVELATASESDVWIATCRRTRELYLASGISPERVHLSYYGLDLSSPAPEDRGSLRRELGVLESRALVGMVAYLYPPRRLLGHRRGLKGHEDLVDALGLCRRHGIDVQGVFVGGAWGPAQQYERRVRAYAAERLGPAATFLGTRRDVASLYGQLDVAVHPSHSENVGGAGESLLAGVPTVATSVGGLPDFVVAGRTGWLVPPRDPRALADAIAEALADPARGRRMAQAGRELVLEQLDVGRTAREVLAIYERLVPGVACRR
jgi:glycosyltransferase involved in cell wall biosynthesis